MKPTNQTQDRPTVRVVSARTSVLDHLVDIWTYRELLVGLVRKELAVKYKNSVVGIGWSMVNPALTLAVYYVVFQIVLKNGVPAFAIFLLSGLLVWNLFSACLPAATGSIVGNSAIVKKVSFPREILALASVGAALEFFFFQLIVLVAALVLFRYQPAWGYLALLPLALVALLTFSAAIGVLLAALNVYFRDIQHLLEVALMAWFWGTPIVYGYRLVADRLGRWSWVFRLNPMTPIVLTFQRAIYGQVSPSSTVKGQPRLALLPAHAGQAWYIWQLLGVLFVSAVLFLFAIAVFSRLEGNFAEEL